MMKVLLCNAPVESAVVLARQIVESELAACVNVLSPVTSIYRWQGELCEEQEAIE
jgi:periplasmic divalent cation tolerance protein